MYNRAICHEDQLPEEPNFPEAVIRAIERISIILKGMDNNCSVSKLTLKLSPNKRRAMELRIYLPGIIGSIQQEKRGLDVVD